MDFYCKSTNQQAIYTPWQVPMPSWNAVTWHKPSTLPCLLWHLPRISVLRAWYGNWRKLPLSTKIIQLPKSIYACCPILPCTGAGQGNDWNLLNPVNVIPSLTGPINAGCFRNKIRCFPPINGVLSLVNLTKVTSKQDGCRLPLMLPPIE